MKFGAFSVAVCLCLTLFLTGLGFAQKERRTGERIVVCMIQLEHADAEELAAVLEPLLSPEGSIVPYPPTNILIIRDRASLVDQLSIAIKGRPCASVFKQPEAETKVEQGGLYLDR